VPDNPPDTFDAYERQTAETLTAWSPQQRLAFVAALADRWLSAYEKFSAKEGQGDPAVLRQIVGAVWDQLRGRLIAPADATRFHEQISENVPDTEDFDGLSAWSALQACVLLGLALECCQQAENVAPATKAVTAAFAAALGDWPSDPAGQQRAWKKVAAQKERAKQTALLEGIGPLVQFDDQAVAQLRSQLGLTDRPNRTRRARPPSKKKRVDDDSIDGWRVAVRGHLKRSAAHRVVFTAALADRHLPLYQAFAATTGQGRPELLASVLVAVWQAAKGQPDAAALPELQAKLRQGALDTRDSTAWGAWSAWRLLELALESCASAENTEAAEEASVVAYDCVAGPGSRDDPQVWKNQHRRPEVHNEIMKQMMLLLRLHGMPVLDEQSVEAVRRRP
jgi:uncharacterized protein YjaG (DUF416 family)